MDNTLRKHQALPRLEEMIIKKLVLFIQFPFSRI